MKVTTAIAALSLGLASVGLAQAADLSRAQVVDQLHAAQAQGLVNYGDGQPYPMTTTASTLSRADVLNELHLAQSQGLVVAAGEVATLNYPQLAEGSPKSRAEVRADLASARDAGQVFITENEAYPL